jgi:hypothetical protein
MSLMSRLFQDLKPKACGAAWMPGTSPGKTRSADHGPTSPD